ncbi:GPW/gp25 family protein [uncultured Tateyamaria sp.]|uniref:GPW/gp25 family protein n=1 Tax=uncultured Tateyamaria sp. TaxID=455651 RepID=UPI0026026F06|nr:GPW/gp25 family protein [uncultured Tateyamaria sp.]
MMQLEFPYGFDGRDRTAETSEEEHIRDLIEQVLFTNPGERVNRPEFGAGVLQLVFGAATPEAAATAEFMIRGALQQYLGQRISVEEITAEAVEAAIEITIVYRILRSDSLSTTTFRLGEGI